MYVHTTTLLWYIKSLVKVILKCKKRNLCRTESRKIFFMLYPNYFKHFEIKMKSTSQRGSTVYQGVRRLYHSRTVCTDSACASPLWPVCNMNCTTLLVHSNVSRTWTRPVEFESVERVRIYFNISVLLVHCRATRTWTRLVCKLICRVRIGVKS